MEIELIESDTARMDDYIALYQACFPQADKLRRQYLNWLYIDNPEGRALGADAVCDGKVIGQVIALPGRYRLRGRQVRGLVAVNVAVHPDFQGKHLFKRLGLKMCEFGALRGFEFVIGVANAAATPGWVRQMGFQLVGPLQARVGLGALNARACEEGLAQADLFQEWGDAALQWRTKSPVNPVALQRGADGQLRVFASAGKPGMTALAVLPPAAHEKVQPNGLGAGLLSAKVFVGNIPGYRFGVNFQPIPERLKPSPLNLIYKNLVDNTDKLSLDKCYITFLDFDAF